MCSKEVVGVEGRWDALSGCCEADIQFPEKMSFW